MELRSNKKRKTETIPTETETIPSESETIPPGVIFSHPQGFKIEELVKGKPGGKKAVPGARATVRYIGKLQKNGKIFADFTKTLFEFIVGAGEVLWGVECGVGGSPEFLRGAKRESFVDGMLVGDKRKITLPPHMGYGKNGDGNLVPPNAWLVFQVELLHVRNEMCKVGAIATFEVKPEYGITIEELVEGNPDGKVAVYGARIRVRYTGMLQKNGEIFDSKFSKKPKSYLLGSGTLGPGVDFGINGMRVGEKRKITVPPIYRCYKRGGLVLPRHAWQVFQVELVGVADQVKNCSEGAADQIASLGS